MSRSTVTHGRAALATGFAGRQVTACGGHTCQFARRPPMPMRERAAHEVVSRRLRRFQLVAHAADAEELAGVFDGAADGVVAAVAVVAPADANLGNA
jgi:hypothetical protein